MNALRFSSRALSITLTLAFLTGTTAHADPQQGNGPAKLEIRVFWPEAGHDVDMYVFEPGGNDPASYRNRNTRVGGVLEDATRGGTTPERYTINQGPSGLYWVRLKMFTRNARSEHVIIKIFSDGRQICPNIDRSVEWSGNPDNEGVLVASIEVDQQGNASLR